MFTSRSLLDDFDGPPPQIPTRLITHLRKNRARATLRFRLVAKDFIIAALQRRGIQNVHRVVRFTRSSHSQANTHLYCVNGVNHHQSADQQQKTAHEKLFCGQRQTAPFHAGPAADATGSGSGLSSTAFGNRAEKRHHITPGLLKGAPAQRPRRAQCRRDLHRSASPCGC